MAHIRRFRTYYRMNRSVGEWHMSRHEAAWDAFKLTRRVARHRRAAAVEGGET